IAAFYLDLHQKGFSPTAADAAVMRTAALFASWFLPVWGNGGAGGGFGSRRLGQHRFGRRRCVDEFRKYPSFSAVLRPHVDKAVLRGRAQDFDLVALLQA